MKHAMRELLLTSAIYETTRANKDEASFRGELGVILAAAEVMAERQPDPDTKAALSAMTTPDVLQFMQVRIGLASLIKQSEISKLLRAALVLLTPEKDEDDGGPAQVGAVIPNMN